MAGARRPRDQALLRFIAGYQAAHGGVSPSIRACARGIGITSFSHIVTLLRRLEHGGFIRRLRHRHQAIEVLRVPAIPMIGDTPLYAVPMEPGRRAVFCGEPL